MAPVPGPSSSTAPASATPAATTMRCANSGEEGTTAPVSRQLQSDCWKNVHDIRCEAIPVAPSCERIYNSASFFNSHDASPDHPHKYVPPLGGGLQLRPLQDHPARWPRVHD